MPFIEELEQPTPNAFVNIERIPIPETFEPHVESTPEVSDIVDSLSIDHEGIRDLLCSNGLDPNEASSIYYRFSTESQFRRIYEMPAAIAGLHTPSYHAIDESNPSGLLKYQHLIVVPISPKVLSVGGLANLNSVIRHELGHSVENRPKESKSLYSCVLNKENYVESTEKFLGIKPERIARAASFIGLDPLLLLHSLDPFERAANKFDRLNRKFNPITLK